jgi:hypothetical protein
MALVLADRVKETTTTTGTTDFVLSGADTGFQTFSAGVGANNTTYYAVALGSDFEIGLGTLSADGLTLARTTVLQSSNSDTKVSFAAGSKFVFVTYPADKAVLTDATQTLTNKTLNSPTLVTPVLGTPSSGTLSACTVDGTDAVGFRNIPQNSQSADYTLVLSDSGKHILHPSSDANARTFTIPANSSVAYPIGTAITFINMTSQVVTIAITTDTMYLSSAGTTGSRSLAQYGSATAIKITSTNWLISGSGLT